MIIPDKIQPLRTLLVQSAKHGRTIDYPSVYSTFGDRDGAEETQYKSDVWDTFEAACRDICDVSTANYGALMARGALQLPEMGFFDVFRTSRSEDYQRIAGDTHPAKISSDMRRQMVEFERPIVWAHAKTLPYTKDRSG